MVGAFFPWQAEAADRIQVSTKKSLVSRIFVDIDAEAEKIDKIKSFTDLATQHFI
jgi:hypothetical protein